MKTKSDRFTIKRRTTDRRKPKMQRVAGVSFVKRQQARQWCRNHRYTIDHDGLFIIHPDGTHEKFTWDGIR